MTTVTNSNIIHCTGGGGGCSGGGGDQYARHGHCADGTGPTGVKLDPFPVAGMLPKQDTEAAAFLAKHPEYDGRGTVIAVLDTGVDPTAPGLQVTTTGAPKMLDIIDCTGAGDVAMCAPVAPAKHDCSGGKDKEPQYTVRGRSGRELVLDAKWCQPEHNPAGTFRLGVKRAYELWPAPLVKRIKEDNRARLLDRSARLEAAVRDEIASGDSTTTSSGSSSSSSSSKTTTDQQQKRSDSSPSSEPAPPPVAPSAADRKADGEARLEALRAFEASNATDDGEDTATSLSDQGPVYDVIAWHDGKHWRVVLDTDHDLDQAAGAGASTKSTADEKQQKKASPSPSPSSSSSLSPSSSLLTPGGSHCKGHKSCGKRDLRGRTPLASYRFFRDTAFFGAADHCVYSINVYDGGDVVSVVTLAGSHGSHCAAIAAAHHPEEPERNGLAPGAQVVSLKIGDTRLGSMETGPGLARAALAMAQHRVDLANMSYGEAAHVADAGRFVALLRDQVVRQYHVIFVSSAGNEGPALSTVGAPGGTSSGVIGVGAHVGHAQMAAEYNLVDPARLPPREYTWSSRGPTYDGATGVDVYAPGSAITSVPSYQLAGSQLMNGTSMSSPNACGNMALLVSAWKAQFPNKGPLHTQRLLQALVATGRTVETCPMKRPFLRIDRAWEHLVEHKDVEALDARFALDVATGGSNAAGNGLSKGGRGIYLRELEETARPAAATVTVKPEWPLPPPRPQWPEFWAGEPASPASVSAPPLAVPDAAEVTEQNARKLRLDLRLALIPTAAWLRAPAHAHFTNDGRSFPVEVDAHLLPPGLHFAEVLAVDPSRPDLGSLFAVPVTVCKPEQPSQASTGGAGGASPVWNFDNVVTGPGSISRHFIAVPEGATFADISLATDAVFTTHGAAGGPSAAALAAPTIFLVRALQLVPGDKWALHGQTYRYSLGLDAQRFATRRMRVEGGRAMEVCLAQWWAAPRSHRVSVRVEFFGVRVAPAPTRSRALVQGDVVTRLDLVNAAGFRAVPDANVTATVENLRKYYAPADAAVRALGERDLTPALRRVSQLLLSYNFSVPDGSGAPTAAAATVSVTPQLPGLEGVLYDAPYSSYLLLVHEAATKRLVATSDMYRHSVKLRAGTEYTVRVQITSEDTSMLEKLKHAALAVDLPAPGAGKAAAGAGAGVDLYDSFAAAVARESSGKLGKVNLARGDRRPVYAVLPPDLKDARPGDQLLVNMSVAFGGHTKVDGGMFPMAVTITQGQGGGTAAGKEGGKNGKAFASGGAEAAACKEPGSGRGSPAAAPAAASSPGNPAGGGSTGVAAGGKPGPDLDVFVRDAKLAYLRALEAGSSAQNDFAAQLERDYPSTLPVQVALLDVARTPADVNRAADAALAQIDRGELALALQSPEPEARRDAEHRRDTLVAAVTRKAIAVLDTHRRGGPARPGRSTPPGSPGGGGATSAGEGRACGVVDDSAVWDSADAGAQLAPLVAELRTWQGADLPTLAAKSPQLLRVVVAHYMVQGLGGLALRATTKHIEAAGSAAGSSGAGRRQAAARALRRAILNRLAWSCWTEVDARGEIARAPRTWELF